MRDLTLPAGSPPLPSPPAVRHRVRLFLQILLLIMAVMLFASYLLYRQDLGDARKSALGSSQLIETRCGTIEYASEGAGAPVLVLHGTGGGWDQGILASSGLIAHGFRVIAPSRFGYLRTTMPADPSPQAEADTWPCFLDALGVQRVPVIAMSAGATPALQLALRHPDRVSALVLLVPASGGIAPDPAVGPSAFLMNVVLRSDFPFWAMMKVAPSTMLKIVAVPASLVPTLQPQDRAQLDATIAKIFPVSQRRLGLLNDAHNQMSSEAFALERISTPTLLISAEDDLYKTLPNAQIAAARIPNARLIAFETGGHLLLGRGSQVWPAIAEFIRR